MREEVIVLSLVPCSVGEQSARQVRGDPGLGVHGVFGRRSVAEHAG